MAAAPSPPIVYTAPSLRRSITGVDRAAQLQVLEDLDSRHPWLHRAATFNPKEPRDPMGKWAAIPGTGGSDGSDGGDGKGKGKGGKLTPLTDAEYEAHTALIEQRIGEALRNGEATDAVYAIDAARGIWQPERAKLHKEIVNDFYAKGAKVPNDGKVVIAGGLFGAGKTTVLTQHAGVDPSGYLTLSPDDIKEEMARKGMVPDVPDLAPMEAATLVHEESTHIANLIAKRAEAERKNIVWDISMASRASVDRRATEARTAGYDSLASVFVDIPIETSVERALSRHRKGMEDYRNGKGYGGRYAPPSFIRKNESDTASSANRAVFDELRAEHDFDSWALYDNSGTGPVLIAEGKG